MKNIITVSCAFALLLLLSFTVKPSHPPVKVPGIEKVLGPSTEMILESDTNITRWGGRATSPDSIIVNNPPNQDNTFRQLTNRYYSPVDGTGADTISLYPRAFNTIIQYNAVDSLAFQVTNLGQSYIGDQMTFLVLNASGSGHQVKFIGSNWQFGSGGASISLTSAKRATIFFIFDGVYWFEQARTVQ